MCKMIVRMNFKDRNEDIWLVMFSSIYEANTLFFTILQQKKKE